MNNANSSESKNKNKKQGMNIMGSTLMFRSSFYLFSLGSRPNLRVRITKAGASLQFGWKKRKQRRMKEEKVTAEEETASDSRRVRNQDEVMNKTRNTNRKCESDDKSRDEIKRMKQVCLILSTASSLCLVSVLLL